MTDDLAVTIGRREGATLEFKRQADDREAIRRAVCALANDLVGAGGGTLLIGVADDGTPHPVDTDDDALLAITNLRDDGKTLDRPSIVVTAATFAGAPVIRVDVAASAAPPVRVNGVVWVRPGPTTRRATRDDERVLSERRLSLDLPYDLSPLGYADHFGRGIGAVARALARNGNPPAVFDISDVRWSVTVRRTP